MNEEQAVLDFFAQTDNLALGLSVAEQMDQVREQMNNRFWQDLLQRFDKLIIEHNLPWQATATEDKNAPDSLAGLHFTPRLDQPLYLRPMLEQQYLGGAWRIYFGLMWSGTPAPGQLGLAAVGKLKSALQHAGFKNNENFLAWQWSMLYPRRRDFLLRYSQQPEKLLNEAEATLKTLLLDHRDTIEQANAELNTVPHSLSTALNKLRDELIG